MSIQVVKPGVCTSLQDCGRFAYQHLGVSPSGAMDELSHRMANVLVGNAQDHASLEITLQGPSLRFNSACVFALCGAQLQATLNDAPVAYKRPLLARPGDILSFGARQSGVRTYMAVYGGFDVKPVLGSQSTFIRGGLGGWHGRALKRDDVLPLARTPSLSEQQLKHLDTFLWNLRIYLPAALTIPDRKAIRLIPGEHLPLFEPASQQSLFGQTYRIASSSERMGYRLEGRALHRKDDRELLSSATSFGTVQVPNDGMPIVLMADRQTTGGYPKVAQVAAVDLPALAQRLPGSELQFEPISVDQAALLDQQRYSALTRLEQSLAPLRAQLAQGEK